MNTLYNIALVLIANIIGFFGISMTYHLSIAFGLFTLNNALLDNGDLQNHYFVGTTIAWMICAILSLGFFIVRGKMRGGFLLLPALLPAVYGLSVLLRLGTAPL